jgi:alanyl-tRNA synthetase
MTSSEIRESFLAFFEKHAHRRVPSSPLLPADDPTLLFTNAGMNQFKDVFTGEEKRDYSRAASSQRCVRAGGKHNDLENVGFTARHHTFFEMLGNFSFGDYFKEGAIEFAHSLLVKEWKIDPKRLMFTVFSGADGIPADDEARALWRRIAGVDDDRVLGLGMKDNFWAMGDTGPCGPCSEIHYHFGDDIPCAAEAAGGRCEGPACDCDRWTEIWNLVFMQYERFADGTMKPLPAPSIDTGMGLERVTCVIQGKRSNYETDLFRILIGAIGDITGIPYDPDRPTDVSQRVVADHLRASAFLIGDGVYPSNEGRGYVLRRIMRRMIRHARLLGATEPIVYRLVPTLTDEMAAAHPVLRERQDVITAAIRREEDAFLATLDRGMGLLEEVFATSPTVKSSKTLPGAVVFKLYDTYGFPPDLTAIIARDRGVGIDQPGFETEMQKQRERSRAASDFSAAKGLVVPIDSPTEFLGYNELALDASVLAVIEIPGVADAGGVRDAGGGDAGATDLTGLVLDRTPFYAESGGQIGDRGSIAWTGGRLAVERTEKNARGVYVHIGRIEGPAPVAGTLVRAAVDRVTRLATERHHTATHLLHAALRRVLGDHVQQAGSYVGPDRLRFDFSHFQAMTPFELAEVERIANDAATADLEVAKRVYPIEEARKLGAMAFFGEKYGEFVRVVAIEGERDYERGENVVASREFCGGSHVRRSGEIGLIKIVSESAIASGVRRLEAVAGLEAVRWVETREAILEAACARLSAPPSELDNRLERVLEERRKLEKELGHMKAELALTRADEVLQGAIAVADVRLAAVFLPDLDPASLRTVSDRMVKSLGSGVVVVGSNPAGEDGSRKAALCVQVSRDLTARLKAGEIVGRLAKICGGGGGGRPDMAQAGGKEAEKVPQAVRAAEGVVRELLGASAA